MTTNERSGPVETTNKVLDAVLRDFALPHIEERLSRDFFYQLGLRFPQQYGIACRDVAACVRRAEALGAGPFLHTTTKAPSWIEHGELRPDCKLEFALGYAGDTQVELLGPGEGTEHYTRALRDADIAFHHVGIYQEGIEQLAKSLTAAGYAPVVQGGLSFGQLLSIDFRYFDARHEHGIYLEVLDFSALSVPLNLEPLLRAYATAKSITRRLNRKSNLPRSGRDPR